VFWKHFNHFLSTSIKARLLIEVTAPRFCKATMLNPFDAGILSFLNGFAHRSWLVDGLLRLVSENYLFKGAVPAALMWWVWFRRDERTSGRRQLLLSSLFAGFLALVVSRGLAQSLPFRERPLHNPAVHFQLPYGEIRSTLIGWSSFPSDHAALFFALGTAFFFVSRTIGILALLHAFFMVCLPRVYLGFHYPSDIVVGAVIGVASAWVSQRLAVWSAAPRAAIEWTDAHPQMSYALLFFVTFQIAIGFDSVRQVGQFVWSMYRAGGASLH
jgi:undecaprenyl-diphosphatase